MHFAKGLESTSFLDSPVIATARASCRLNPKEKRMRRDQGACDSVKMPVCEGMLMSMRVRLWDNRGWGHETMEGRTAYLGCVWGFDMSARVSEYTQPEPGATDLTFIVEDTGSTISVAGGDLAVLLEG